MAKYRVLVNPKASAGKGSAKAKELEKILSDSTLSFCDVTEIKDYNDFFASLTDDENIIIAGGDGTLSRFVNDTLGIEYNNDVYYYPCGTGNDFMNDIEASPSAPVLVNEYIKNLPIAEINGKKYKFINGIGYGIDGYCCEEGDKLREAGRTNINYTAIAIKGLLYGYKRVNAKITVDGEVRRYKKVWLAPTMNGRFYGGGMMATPSQNRLNGENTVTVSPMYGGTKLKTLLIFPSIFKGEHVRHKEMVDVMHGHEVEVEFDCPTALQIDGETVLNVLKYTVHAGDAARRATTLDEF